MRDLKIPCVTQRQLVCYGHWAWFSQEQWREKKKKKQWTGLVFWSFLGDKSYVSKLAAKPSHAGPPPPVSLVIYFHIWIVDWNILFCLEENYEEGLTVLRQTTNKIKQHYHKHFWGVSWLPKYPEMCCLQPLIWVHWHQTCLEYPNAQTNLGPGFSLLPVSWIQESKESMLTVFRLVVHHNKWTTLGGSVTKCAHKASSQPLQIHFWLPAQLKTGHGACLKAGGPVLTLKHWLPSPDSCSASILSPSAMHFQSTSVGFCPFMLCASLVLEIQCSNAYLDVTPSKRGWLFWTFFRTLASFM